MPTKPELDHALHLLEAGELVAFPTETVYGLGADAENPAAVAKIFAAKGRPANHPVIVHLAPNADPAYWCSAWPDQARALAAAFWPGPLTLIVPRAAHIPPSVSGGQASIGLRMPAHPVAQALLSGFHGGRGGIAAPSANRFGHVSPTTAAHVRDEFGASVHVLDGGACPVGIESTILDLSRGFPALLRPGRITPAQLATVLGEFPRLPDGSDTDAPRASGTLAAHYAPRTPVTLATADRIMAMLVQGGWGGESSGSTGEVGSADSTREGGSACQPGTVWEAGVPISQRVPTRQRVAVVASRSLHARLLALDLAGVDLYAAPTTPAAFENALYRLLRELDDGRYGRMMIEAPPRTAEWTALADRLGRAAAAFDGGDVANKSGES